MRKTLAVAAVAGSLGIAGVGGAAIAHAQTNSSTNPTASLVDAIAKKFNLDKSEVQKVVDEQHQAMETERENELKAELAQLVKDGKLTQAQADKLTAKRAELQKERDAARTNNSSATRTDRKSLREQQKTQLDTWLKEQNIDTKYAYLLHGNGGHGPRGGDGPRGEARDNSSDSTSDKSS